MTGNHYLAQQRDSLTLQYARQNEQCITGIIEITNPEGTHTPVLPWILAPCLGERRQEAHNTLCAVSLSNRQTSSNKRKQAAAARRASYRTILFVLRHTKTARKILVYLYCTES